jgi:hypothetical protein
MSFRRYLINQYHTDQRDHLFSLKNDRHAEIDSSETRQTNLQISAGSRRSMSSDIASFCRVGFPAMSCAQESINRRRWSEVLTSRIERFTRSGKLKGRSNSSLCQNLSKSQIDRFPLNFVVLSSVSINSKTMLWYSKTQILNGRRIRISNLHRDVRGIFQRASPVSEFQIERF